MLVGLILGDSFDSDNWQVVRDNQKAYLPTLPSKTRTKLTLALYLPDIFKKSFIGSRYFELEVRTWSDLAKKF